LICFFTVSVLPGHRITLIIARMKSTRIITQKKIPKVISRVLDNC